MLKSLTFSIYWNSPLDIEKWIAIRRPNPNLKKNTQSKPKLLTWSKKGLTYDLPPFFLQVNLIRPG